jgi:hypothetical protein
MEEMQGENISKVKSPEQIYFEREFLLSIPVYFKDKQVEKFCQLIALENISATDAYKLAFPNSKASEKTKWEAASRLSRKKDVLERIQQLRAPVIAKARMGFIDIIKQFEDIATDTREKVQTARVRANEDLLKIKGINLDNIGGLNIGESGGGSINIFITKKQNEL